MALAGLGALVLATFLQLALPGGVLVWGVEPNLVLALVVGWTWVRGPRWAFVGAVLAGLLLDLSGGGVIGVHAVGLLAAAYVVGLVRSLVEGRGWWWLSVPAGALGGALYGGIQVAALTVLQHEPLARAPAAAMVAGAAGSGAILSLPFQLLFSSLDRSLARRRLT